MAEDLNGNKITTGDKVIIGGSNFGLVVGDLDEMVFASGFIKDEWSYLLVGLLIQTDFAGLVHYDSDDCRAEIEKLID